MAGTRPNRRVPITGRRAGSCAPRPRARQGEIILGKWGRWIWICCFALLVLLILVLGLWR
jgi:hypothetical protein